MCIYCDLKKSGREKELAIVHLEVRIKQLNELAQFYHQILCGKLKPHTEDMKRVNVLERIILRKLAENI